MKKIIVLLLIILLCSCTSGDKREEQKSINKLTEKFSYTNGICLRDNTNVLFSFLDRGEPVLIIDEDDEYYFVDKGSLTLKILKKYIRTELDEPFNEYHAYTRGGSRLYSDIGGNDAVDTFSLNEEIKVIDEFADMLYVESNGIKGYMYPSQVSKTIIPIYIAPEPQYEETYTPSGSSGGGSSESSSPTPSPEPTPAPTPIPQQSGDGEDISIFNIPKHKAYYTSYSNELTGIVLMDNTEVYLTAVNRNESICILNETEEEYIILVNGYQGKINKKYVRKENEEVYEEFEGYTISGAPLYSDYEMKNRVLTFGVNEIVTIIDEVDGVYVIELDNGEEGYMKKTNISKNRIYIAPKEEPIKEEPTHSESSGGSGSSPSPEPTPAPVQPAEEWTPAAL